MFMVMMTIVNIVMATDMFMNMDMDMDKHTPKDTYTIMDMGTDMYSGWKIYHVQYARKERYKLDAVTDPYKPIIAWSTTV